MATKKRASGNGEEQIGRVRRICMSLPATEEKLSHGEPTFFVGKKVYTMCANNHHDDGHVAVWIPAEPGMQESLIALSAKKYFRPPYVGVKGWVGVEIDEVSEEELALHIREAWQLIAPKKLKGALMAGLR
jgi:hypothetical protein